MPLEFIGISRISCHSPPSEESKWGSSILNYGDPDASMQPIYAV